MTESADALVESWLYANDKALDLGREESARVECAAVSRGHDLAPDRHASARDPATRAPVGRNTR